MSLRKKLIRLAYTNPELRPKLLPLLKQADMTPGDGYYWDGTKLESDWGRQARLDSSILRKFKPNSFFRKFFEEKNIPYKIFSVRDSRGMTHEIPNEVVIEAIAGSSPREQQGIERILRQIDFKNGDVNHFLEHLAKGLAESYDGALRSAGSQRTAGATVRSVKDALSAAGPHFLPYLNVTKGFPGEGIRVFYNNDAAFGGPGLWDKTWKVLENAGFQLRTKKERNVAKPKTFILVS